MDATKRGWRWGVLVLVVLCQALVGVLVWHEMRPRMVASESPHALLHVRLFDRRPLPVVAPFAAHQRKKTAAGPVLPPETSRSRASGGHSSIERVPLLYGTDGRLSMVPAPQDAHKVVIYRPAAMRDGDVELLRHDAGYRYRVRNTRLAVYFPPAGESTVDSLLRRLLESTHRTATIKLPGGVRIHCATVLFIVPAGCGGDGPPPQPSTDGDPRLDMTGPPLIMPRKRPQSSRLLSHCLAVYRAGQPLPAGCPADILKHPRG